ncbi:MAG: hypothetical protein PHP31_03135 [Lentimicrobiaceae bacterium]|nr:hypothetical protein [Lentimicrobiaceae bacterium]
MNFDTILNSIITATSILVAVGFPFIILITTNHKSRKERLLIEIKTYYPRLNAFRELISKVSATGIVDNYDRLKQKAKKEEGKKEIEKKESYGFYRAIDYISKEYSKDCLSESIHYRIFNFEEIQKYHSYANTIWYDINCRTDIVKELNTSQFSQMSPFERGRMQEIILSINPKYKDDEITIGLIAKVAGDIEMEVIYPLLYLTQKYEEPIPPLVKKLFFTLSSSLLVGVIIPLFMMQYMYLMKLWMLISIVSLITIFYSLIVIFTGKYIWRNGKN